MPFATWLREKCESRHAGDRRWGEELRALAVGPSRRACTFKSMTSFGSHYKVQADEEGPQHVTFNSGVGVLAVRAHAEEPARHRADVLLARVGILKGIVVLNYGHMSIVLMDVSWVAQDNELRPRLRRDDHGFWLANLAARPWDKTTPYFLPALASHVHMLDSVVCGKLCRRLTCLRSRAATSHVHPLSQVFFADDKSMPGWCVVLKTEARGRIISCTDMEHSLGQEESCGDRAVL